MKIASFQTNSTRWLVRYLFFVLLFFSIIYLTNIWPYIAELNFPTKKLVGAYINTLHNRMELGSSRDWYGWNIIMYKNGKLHSLYDWTLQKVPIIWEKVSSKSYFELNCLQKSQWMHMSISPWSGAIYHPILIIYTGWLKSDSPLKNAQ